MQLRREHFLSALFRFLFRFATALLFIPLKTPSQILVALDIHEKGRGGEAPYLAKDDLMRAAEVQVITTNFSSHLSFSLMHVPSFQATGLSRESVFGSGRDHGPHLYDGWSNLSALLDAPPLLVRLGRDRCRALALTF